ncbi:MAG: hypothetical protein ACE5ES_00475 [Candidatus Nanoarchaeia archaeon]
MDGMILRPTEGQVQTYGRTGLARVDFNPSFEQMDVYNEGGRGIINAFVDLTDLQSPHVYWTRGTGDFPVPRILVASRECNPAKLLGHRDIVLRRGAGYFDQEKHVKGLNLSFDLDSWGPAGVILEPVYEDVGVSAQLTP